MGRAGQVSIGNGALMAVGGFLTAGSDPARAGRCSRSRHRQRPGRGRVGLIIALPSLRRPGDLLRARHARAAVPRRLRGAAVRGSGPVRCPVSRSARRLIGGIQFEYGPSYVVLLAAVTGRGDAGAAQHVPAPAGPDVAGDPGERARGVDDPGRRAAVEALGVRRQLGADRGVRARCWPTTWARSRRTPSRSTSPSRSS